MSAPEEVLSSLSGMSIVPNSYGSLKSNDSSCAACLQPFSEIGGCFYPVDGKNYCEHDYKELYAPRCADCNEIIEGKSVSVGGQKYHPECFNCEVCGISLLNIKFVDHKGLRVCKSCQKDLLQNPNQKAKDICGKCQRPIKGNDFVMWKGKKCCPHHFNCNMCGIILTKNAQTYKDKLYCPLCFPKVKLKYCFACKMPIEGRVITALGKTWHPEHFVCSVCECPLSRGVFYEHKGQAYCETHYHRLIGRVCFKTNNPMKKGEIEAMGKTWGKENFDCFGCGVNLSEGKLKFAALDGRPYCSKCYSNFDKNTLASMRRCQDGRALLEKMSKKRSKEKEA